MRITTFISFLQQRCLKPHIFRWKPGGIVDPFHERQMTMLTQSECCGLLTTISPCCQKQMVSLCNSMITKARTPATLVFTALCSGPQTRTTNKLDSLISGTQHVDTFKLDIQGAKLFWCISNTQMNCLWWSLKPASLNAMRVVGFIFISKDFYWSWCTLHQTGVESCASVVWYWKNKHGTRNIL
jgi:hypothetical protein